MNKIQLIAIFGKAGAGKDYIFKQVCFERPELNRVVSDTTRPPREGEVDGTDYNFLTFHQFADTKHLEVTSYKVANRDIWLYGTPKNALKRDKINIGVFNVEGISSIYHKHPEIELHSFYIQANPRVRLIRQMDREFRPNYTEICRRFLADEEDFKNFDFPCTWLQNSQSFEASQAIDLILHDIDDLVKTM